MNPTSTLRETTPPTPAPRTKRHGLEPVRVLVDRERLAKLWFIIALLVLIGAAWDRQQLVTTLKQPERIVVLDPAGTYHVSPALDFEDARELHTQQATLAVMALFNRGPKDVDQPELLKRILLTPARKKAEAMHHAEAKEFLAKELHQKAEVARIDVLQTRADAVLTQVTGQIIRTGWFQEKAFTEAVPFTLKLKMQRNPDMTLNGRFPTAVLDFSYENAR